MDVYEDEVLRYFQDGLTYMEIIEFLRVKHEFIVSLSTLKRWLRKRGIKKRSLLSNRCSDESLCEAVQSELDGSSSDLGYRRIHKLVTNKGIICRRNDVRKVIKMLDPQGTELRAKRRMRRRKYYASGPNYVWHIDGHDKLKPYGFSIHGCIDGFSRKIIWLEVGTTNKMPEVVAKYYLDAVSNIQGIPQKIKADDGTEHSLIQPIHLYLGSVANPNVDFNSFSIVTSPRNQRIEAYWSFLQRDKIGWWKRFFRDLFDNDMLSTDDPVAMDCIRYCFMYLIREDLISIASDWNAHIISKSRTNSGPRGRPNCMFHLPHLYDTTDFSLPIEQSEVDEFYPTVRCDVRDFSPEFEEFASIIMTENGLQKPTNPTEGLILYTFLMQKIEVFG